MTQRQKLHLVRAKKGDALDHMVKGVIAPIDPDTAYKAALNLTEAAIRANDTCGLSTVLDALSIKEIASEHKK
jgi:hypothetical protein